MAERLTADQLAALAPGDTVAIESYREGFARTRRTTGTVIRVDGSRILVKTRSPRGRSTFVEQYGRRDGVRVGGVTRAELVTADAAEPSSDQQRHTRHIDSLYRAWTRNRGDVDTLRELHAAIAEHLAESPASQRHTVS